MYYYIIDPQKLNQKEFERVQNQLYSCLSELRISGETSRVTPLRPVSQLVETALERGATTIIAVGTDATLQEVINALGERDMTIGFVPIMRTELSVTLGIPDVESACRIIAQRRVEHLDLGRIGTSYFLTALSFGASLAGNTGLTGWLGIKASSALAGAPPFKISLKLDQQLAASAEIISGLVLNSRSAQCSDISAVKPNDGMLDIMLLPKLSRSQALIHRHKIAAGCWESVPGVTVFHAQKIFIDGPEGLSINIEGKTVGKCPGTIEVLTRRIRIIVGRERMF